MINTGTGHRLQVIEIGHPEYLTVIQPDTAFWAIVKKEDLGQVISEGAISLKLKKHTSMMSREMESLRFGIKPSAVYFNPTDKCNLNCTYCYIPESVRKKGSNMSWDKLEEGLLILKDYFSTTIPSRKPQVVFHGAEPMINKEALFKAIEKYSADFEFGLQTNATLMEEEDFAFLSANKVTVGVSLDGHTALIADRCRKDWAANGTFKKVIKVIEMARGYPYFNLICTITDQNVKSLVRIVDFFHELQVENCLLNPVRCTLEGGRRAKPSDVIMAKMFIKALDRTNELFQKSGRKIIIGNFANILLAIMAPSARRLMCDISPCGGGRCFFSISAKGDIYPCSEFIGMPEFKGGNIFKDDLKMILQSKPFNLITNRVVENIEPCKDCAIRHFCGAPCPAEGYQIHGSVDKPGAFCEFYEHIARYAFRLIADDKQSDYLWDNWDRESKEMYRF